MIMDFSTFIVLPIVLLCLITGYIVKHIVSDEVIENRWIPVIVTLEGIIVGIILCVCGATAAAPLTAEALLNAIVGGGVSGAASTGFQSVFAAFVQKAGTMISSSTTVVVEEETEKEKDE